MPDNKQLNGAYDTSHPLIEKKEVPDSFRAFVTELNSPQHADIVEKAKKEATFEGVLAVVAQELDIIVDGIYDVGPTCAMLTVALKNRYKLKAGVIAAHELAPGFGLTRARIVETEGEVILEEEEDVVSPAPPPEDKKEEAPKIIIP